MQTNTQSSSSLLKYLQIVFFTVVLLYFGKTLLIPLFFGLFIAMVMYPISKWLEQHGWSRPFAIAACLLIVSILLAALLALMAWQLKVFSKDAPAIYNKLEAVALQMQTWIIENIGLTTDMQINWSAKLTDTIGGILTLTFNSTVNTLVILFLTPVYTALFMYQRKVLVKCLRLITPARYQDQLNTILKQTIQTYFNYIKGMILVYIIVGVLNTIGLLALGVKNALLFGMLCAIMTIIPYFGLIISELLPISVVWMETGSIWYVLGVIAVFSFVQYLEANVIFPRVVGTQLNVSTLAVLVAIIAGGIIWGVSGMVLFIPFVSILKIISDNIDEWKPINVLLSR